MTKIELEGQIETLQKKIAELIHENGILQEKNNKLNSAATIGDFFYELTKKDEFRKNMLNPVMKKLEDYGFLSPAILRAFGELKDDTDLIVSFEIETLGKLLNGNIESNIEFLLKYMGFWDNIEAGNGYPEGMGMLYFEGKFDKEEE